MLREMSWQQFLAWMEYAEQEPFGEERADLRIGYALARLASMFTRAGHGFKPAEFMPFAEQEPTTREPITREQWTGFKAAILGQAKSLSEAK